MEVIISQNRDQQGRRLIVVDSESVGLVRKNMEEGSDYYWIAVLNDGKHITGDRLNDIRYSVREYLKDKWGVGSWKSDSKLRVKQREVTQ